MKIGQDDPNPGSQYQTMVTLWSAFLLTTVMYLVVTVIMPRSGEPENRLLTIIFSGLSAFLILVSFVVKSSFLSRSVAAQNVRLVKSGLVLAAALCEAAAILGLLDFLVAHGRYYVALIALSFLGVLLHFPRRSQLEAASYNSGKTLS